MEGGILRATLSTFAGATRGRRTSRSPRCHGLPIRILENDCRPQPEPWTPPSQHRPAFRPCPDLPHVVLPPLASRAGLSARHFAEASDHGTKDAFGIPGAAQPIVGAVSDPLNQLIIFWPPILVVVADEVCCPQLCGKLLSVSPDVLSPLGLVPLDDGTCGCLRDFVGLNSHPEGLWFAVVGIHDEGVESLCPRLARLLEEVLSAHVLVADLPAGDELGIRHGREVSEMIWVVSQHERPKQCGDFLPVVIPVPGRGVRTVAGV